MTSSTYEFHSPQAGHLPTHLDDCAPQLEQKKAVLDFEGMIILFGKINKKDHQAK
jgi:hypothetical protein